VSFERARIHRQADRTAAAQSVLREGISPSRSMGRPTAIHAYLRSLPTCSCHVADAPRPLNFFRSRMTVWKGCSRTPAAHGCEDRCTSQALIVNDILRSRGTQGGV